MHGFNLKTTITTAAAIIKSRVYKCRIQNDKSNTLTHAAVEVIVGHISARQSWRCGSHPVKQPAHDVTRNSSARAEHCAMRAHTHTHTPSSNIIANKRSKYKTVVPHKSIDKVFKYLILMRYYLGVRHVRLRHSCCVKIYWVATESDFSQHECVWGEWGQREVSVSFSRGSSIMEVRKDIGKTEKRVDSKEWILNQNNS